MVLGADAFWAWAELEGMNLVAGYRIILSPGAKRALTSALPPAAAFAAMEFMKGPLAESPKKVGAPLKEPFAGQYRARRGDYRIRYCIDDANQTVYVLLVTHRREVYRS